MRKLYLALLAVIMQLAAFSQTDITIGTGTAGNGTTGYPCPLQDYYEGSRMQYLFLASELQAAGMAAGNISSLKFEVLDTTNTSGRPELIEGMSISIDVTTSASLDPSTWETVTNLVYGPTDYKIQMGTNEFIFTTPFAWNGTDNIVIEVCNGDPNNGAYVSYSANPLVPWTTGLGFNASHSYRADNLGNLCGTATTTNTGTQTTRPNTTFVWAPASSTGCYLATGIAFANIAPRSVDVSWNAPTVGATPVGYMWEVRTSGAPGSGSTGLAASGTSAGTQVTVTGLSPTTAYTLYVMTNCGAGNMSNWSSGSNFTTVASCEVPMTVSHSSIDTATEAISWMPPATTTPIGYHLYYSTTNTPPTSSTSAMDSVAGVTTDTLRNLLGGTTYYVWVRSNCGGGDVSLWTAVDSFRTPSSQYVPIVLSGFGADVIAEGVNAPTASTTNDVDGVHYIFNSLDYQYDATCALPTRGLPVNGEIDYLAGGYNFQLAPYNGDNDLRLTGTDAGTLTFATPLTTSEIYLLGTSGSGASKFNVTVNFTDGTTQEYDSLSMVDWFTTTGNTIVAAGIGRMLNTVTACGGTSTNATQPSLFQTTLIIDAANIYKNVGSVTIARVDGITGFAGIVNIMAITVKKGGTVVPAQCYPATGITFSNVTATSASATWNAPPVGATPVGYMWEVRTSGAPGSGSTGLAASGTTATLNAAMTGLNPLTTYTFYVMTNCGTGNMSGWTTGDQFTTGCAAILNFTELFDGVTVPALPQCWSSILRGTTLPTGAYVRTATGNAYSTPNSVSMYNSTASTTNGDEIILVSPQLNNLNAGTYRITFYAKNSVASEDLEVGTLNDNSATATFTPVQLVDINTTYAKYTVNIATSADQYIGFRRMSTTNNSYVYIDNINWEPIPTCEVPSGVTHYNIDSATEVINWMGPTITSPIGYHIYYSTTNTPPTSSTSPSDSVAGVGTTVDTLHNLAGGTLYYVWVRSNCGGGNSSLWTAVDSFRTPSAQFFSPTISGYNADVIAEGVNAPGVTTTNDVDGVNNSFNSIDYQYDVTCALPARGLPVSGEIYSSAMGMYYHLAPYNGDNDLRLTGTDAGTLTLGTPATAEQIYLLGTSGSGASKFNVDVNFADGSTQSFDSLSLSDWFGGTNNVVIGGIGRLNRTLTACGGTSTNTTDPRLYQTTLVLDSANTYKNVTSLTITRLDGLTGFAGIINIMAVSVKKGAAILPVTLANFRGQHIEGGNKLEWTTRSENNNAGFELQRSADGRSFSKLAFVATRAQGGNSSTALDYAYTDAKPFAGTSYYRLKQSDKDGRYSLSNIVAIRGTRANTLVVSAVYPNPATSKVNVVLNVPANDKVTLVLTDAAGKVVMQQHTQLVSGDNNITLNIATLPQGSYLLKAVCANGCESAVTKVVKN